MYWDLVETREKKHREIYSFEKTEYAQQNVNEKYKTTDIIVTKNVLHTDFIITKMIAYLTTVNYMPAMQTTSDLWPLSHTGL